MFESFRKKSLIKEPEKEEQKQAELYVASELGMMRYEIEHSLLRTLFYENTAPLLARLMDEEGAYGIYDQFFQLSKAANPYSKSDFSAMGGKMDDDHIMVSLELPEPEYTPLCYRIYFVCRNDFSAPAMFTIERGITDGFLCGWNSKGAHLNYHEIKEPARKEDPGLMRAIEAKIIFDLYKGKSNKIL